MSTVTAILRALQILAPLIEEIVNAFRTGKAPDFIQALPSPLASRVALNARKAGLK